jgi:Uma2 family endonuclease
MTARQARAPATYDDLRALPDNVTGELIDGELHASRRPAPPHAFAGSALGADVHSAFHRKPGGPDKPGGWWIVDEPELHLGQHVLVPDLAGWRRARMPHYPPTAYFELVPDWVCEIVSPASQRRDRVLKMALYGELTVRWLWLVDPLRQTVEAFERDSDRWTVAGVAVDDETAARLPPFEAVELEVARWWEGAPPPPPRNP